MTQAFNLSQLANNLNTSGQLDATDGLTGVVPTGNLPTIPVSKGGTNLTATPSNGQIPIGNGSGYSLATITAGSGITVTNGSGSITIASGGGGVTSLNGQTGAITNTSYQAIGSYVMAFLNQNLNVNSTYSTISAYNALYDAENNRLFVGNSAGALSGTWRMLGYGGGSPNGTGGCACIFVRVS